MVVSSETLAIAERASDLFTQIMHKSMSERLAEELTDNEISFAQIQVLRYILVHRSVTVGDIARGLAISYPSATNMMHRLTRKDLIRKNCNTTDQRLVLIELSDRGNELVAQLDRERTRRFALVLERMTPAERDEFLNGLNNFVGLAVQQEIAKADDICLRCGMKHDPQCPVAEQCGLDFCK